MGIILVYDVTDKKSFENLDYWLNRIKDNGEQDAEIILVGNKIEMINEIDVNQTEAADLAQKHKIQYF